MKILIFRFSSAEREAADRILSYKSPKYTETSAY